ncbi:CoA transferase [Yangia mangrovi]|uniref:CoA transferase n=1 Tax=Alloyangia mangrovi TaxID=1779329 RepID=A0A2A3JNR2_9RHOB|nr:CoA transferase [Alloyangia mangrovi]MCT4370053.1 CoA transferase [Alloyangia mangrovi]
MGGALERLRVIDTTHVLAGPFAAYQLGVLGADVIKIEDPNDPDQARMQGSDPALTDAEMGTAFLAQGSNKRCMALDLKTEDGREALLALVDGADVFVENYRPGAFEALGLGYEALFARNPGLVYCSISAFGATGPRREQTGYDNVIQAFCGMMAMTGTEASGPLKCGAPVIDYATGTTAAFAITAALLQRTRTGRGQHVDVSMLDVALMLMSAPLTGYLWNGAHPQAQGNDFFFATLGCYDTADEPLMIAASNLSQQERLWRLLGRPERIQQENNARLAAHAEEKALLAQIFATRPAAEWEEILLAERIPAARVRRLEEAMADPQIAARGVLGRHEGWGPDGRGLTVPVAGFSLSESPARVRTPPEPVGGQLALARWRP